jgi:hypothetical protein
VGASLTQIVPSSHCEERCPGRDQRAARLDLPDGPERVGRSVNEKSRHSEARQVRAAAIGRPAWRVQGVGQQKKSTGEVGSLGEYHAALAAPIGVPTGEDRTSDDPVQRTNRLTDALAIALGGGGRGRPVASRLTVGQVAPERGDTLLGECRSERDQQWSIRI